NTEQPNQGDLYSLISKLLGQSKDIDHIHKYRSNTDLMAHSDSVIQKKDLGSPNAKVVFHPSLMRDRIHKFHQLEATAEPPRSKLLAEGQVCMNPPPEALPWGLSGSLSAADFHLEQVSWPLTSLQLGQVSGLAYNIHSYLVVFHRGDRRWGANSFNLQERYQERFLGPIQQSTILVVDPDVGAVMKASGRNMFYLPHGITTDKDNNYWLTDVALHQVFKVSGNGRDRILVTLGEAFVPGSDSGHFCKPTDVAVDSKTGNVFVSDGYCNARILKFSPEGKYLNEWGAGASDSGRRIPFQIPHSLAFIPDRQELCVADRENGRIQCFIAETGEFVKEIKKEEFGGKVFAITYSPGGARKKGTQTPTHSPCLSNTGWRPAAASAGASFRCDPTCFSSTCRSFRCPHDIVEGIDGVYVGDLDSRQIYKFTLEKSHRSVKKGGIDVQQLDELQVIVKAEVRPQPNRTAVVDEKAAAAVQPHAPEEEEQKEREASKEQTALPVLITVLLLVPLLLIVSTGLFICWRRKDQSELKSEPSSVGGIFGKIRGKAVGGLNLGNFFVSHRGYTRQGFDQLSTEGSDQERNNESSDSELPLVNSRLELHAVSVVGGAAGRPGRAQGADGRITDRFLLFSMERYWHTRCLRCSCCHAELGEFSRSCYSRGGMILCKDDYIRWTPPMPDCFGHTGACSACGQTIPPSGDWLMRAQGSVYHLKCFTCATCRNRLVPGDRFHYINGSIFCEHDHPGPELHGGHAAPLQASGRMSSRRCAEKPPSPFCSTWMLPCSAVAPAWTDVPAAAQLLPRTPKNSDLVHTALTAA
ncbi:hypothetical protein fugu_019469, partial [Takifugu bimaculatus]